MSWLNRLLYPRTDSGRRRYIKDSLKPYRCNYYYLLLILLGIAGLILSLIFCISGIDFSGLWLVVLLSLLIFALGVQGIERREP